MKKHCRGCGEDKSVEDFNRNKAKTDGLQTQCRDCMHDLNKSHYHKSPERRAKLRMNGKLLRVKNAKFLARYKRFYGCRLCREREPVVLDLHHIDPAVKDTEVSKLLHSSDRMKEELRKCAVLCANCHRKFHAGLVELGL
jgi:hypothetical protein